MAWKIWSPILAVLLATAIVLVSIFAGRTVKAPNGDVIRMRGKQTVVSEMTGFIGPDQYRWRLNYDGKNKVINIEEKMIKGAGEWGDVAPYDYYLGIADAFAPLISPTRHPEVYLPIQEGTFPTEITFAFCDLIRSGKFDTIHVTGTWDLGELYHLDVEDYIANVDKTYHFVTNEKHQLVQYSIKDKSEYGDPDCHVSYQYNEQGQLKKIMIKYDDSDSNNFDIAYVFSYDDGVVEVVRYEGEDSERVLTEFNGRHTWNSKLKENGSFDEVHYDYHFIGYDDGDDHNYVFEGDRLIKIDDLSYQYDSKGFLTEIKPAQKDEDSGMIGVDTRYQYTTIKL